MKTFIPQNVIKSDDKIPIDFFIKLSLTKKQLLYIGIGLSNIYMICIKTNILILNKSIISIFILGGYYTISSIKYENQTIDILLFNLIKLLIKKGMKNYELQNITSRFFKFKIQK